MANKVMSEAGLSQKDYLERYELLTAAQDEKVRLTFRLAHLLNPQAKIEGWKDAESALSMYHMRSRGNSVRINYIGAAEATKDEDVIRRARVLTPVLGFSPSLKALRQWNSDNKFKKSVRGLENQADTIRYRSSYLVRRLAGVFSQVREAAVEVKADRPVITPTED